MKKPSTEIYVSPLTVAYIALALILGRFSFIFFHFALSFFHELCHVLAAKCLHKEVKEIAFLPIGFFAKIDDLEELSPWKQIVILVAGPLSFIISTALLIFLRENGIISLYGYRDAQEANRMILLFNLFPIIPLDGGRIVKAILLKFFPIHKADIMSLSISFLMGGFVLWLCIKNKQCLIFFFLFLDLVGELIMRKRRYFRFLLKRLTNKHKYPLLIHEQRGIFVYKDNVQLCDGKLLGEKDIIGAEIKKLRRPSLFKRMRLLKKAPTKVQNMPAYNYQKEDKKY